jgi:hypothetical protein
MCVCVLIWIGAFIALSLRARCERQKHLSQGNHHVRIVSLLFQELAYQFSFVEEIIWLTMRMSLLFYVRLFSSYQRDN